MVFARVVSLELDLATHFSRSIRVAASCCHSSKRACIAMAILSCLTFFLMGWLQVIATYIPTGGTSVYPSDVVVEEGRGGRTDDNEHLDIGSTIAILLSGLTVPITSTHVLPSIVKNIIEPLGSHNIHVFVHTSPWNVTRHDDGSHTCHAPSSACGAPPSWATVGSGGEEGAAKTRELVGMYMDALNESARAIVVDRDYLGSSSVQITTSGDSNHHSRDPGGRYTGREERVQSGFQGEDTWVPRIWEHYLQKKTIIDAGVQFERLRDLYPLVLAEERRMLQRYSHVIRMRTDSTWLSAWKEVEVLHKKVPPRDFVVAFPNPHHHSGTPFIPDLFWIASRAAAKATMVGFAESLALPLDRKAIYDYFGCPWEPEASNQRFQGALQSARHVDPCFVSVLGPNSIFIEVRLKMFMMMQRLEFANSCLWTGPYRHTGSHATLDYCCLPLHHVPHLVQHHHEVLGCAQDSLAGLGHSSRDHDSESRVESGAPGWKQNASAFRVWLTRSSRDVAFSSLLANVPAVSNFKMNSHASGGWDGIDGLADTHSSAVQCDDVVWDIPVAVMSQSHEHKRRESTSRLLREMGFRNVTFPATMKWSEMSVEQMTADGILSTSLFRRMEERNDTNREGYIKYAANALSQIRRIRAAAAANEPVIIMEDDLMAGGASQIVRDHLCRALSDLPATADMVYLEYCFESCIDLMYNPRYPNLAKAVHPACGVAMYFTTKGARRAADLCWPVFDVIDRMYPALIRTEKLEAYLLTPPAFYQNQIFASHWDRRPEFSYGRGLRTNHQPSAAAPPCWELTPWPGIRNFRTDKEFEDSRAGWLLSHIDRRQTGLVLPNTELMSLLAILNGVGAHEQSCYANWDLSDEMVREHMIHVWLRFPMPDAWMDRWGLIPGLKIVYYNRGDIPGSTQNHPGLGSWTSGTHSGILLRFGPGSYCFDLLDDQACELEVGLVSSTNGNLIDTLRVGFYLVRVLAGTDA